MSSVNKVGVIGGGAAGLVACRELLREGFQVVVYEQNSDVGGIWNYHDGIGEDLDCSHGVAYNSLRTNLPREVMGFMDYPFLAKEGRDPRRFPTHREVFLYLKDFATEFNLVHFIIFNTRVEYVGVLEEDLDTDEDPFNQRIRWVVRARSSCASNSQLQEELFDAVVVCNGHYRKPIFADIPGIEKWPGKQIHSLNYRVPELFYDQVVIIIGSSASALDILVELTKVAKEVHLSVRSAYVDHLKDLANHLNIQLHSIVKYSDENGNVFFEDGSSTIADSIIHCTGYSYYFPFLDTNGMVTIDDNHVGPLYEHIFPPLLAPSLSFVGIPKKVIPFPFFELQSKWIASILARKAVLPSRMDMMKSVKELHDYQEMIGLPKRSAHDIGENYQHYDQLADQSDAARIEEWRKAVVINVVSVLISSPITYLDFRDSLNNKPLLSFLDSSKAHNELSIS